MRNLVCIYVVYAACKGTEICEMNFLNFIKRIVKQIKQLISEGSSSTQS